MQGRDYELNAWERQKHTGVGRRAKWDFARYSLLGTIEPGILLIHSLKIMNCI